MGEYIGTAGDDTLTGSPGDGTIDGAGGNDHITGGDGNDVITTGPGASTVDGGNGNDTIFDHGDGSVILAGAGNDAVYLYGTNADVNAGDGHNLLGINRSSQTTPFTFWFAPNMISRHGDAYLPDATKFCGFQAVSVTIGSGDDHVTFFDPICDPVWGGCQWDGGTAYDTAEINLSGMTNNVRSTYAAGRLDIQVYANGARSTVSSLTNVEGVDLIGGWGENNLVGGPGNDWLTTFAGNDVLMGGAGDDTLNGGAGMDVALYSGKHTDYTIIRNGQGVTVSSQNEGTDYLH